MSGSGSNANPANDALAAISRDQFDLVQKFARRDWNKNFVHDYINIICIYLNLFILYLL